MSSPAESAVLAMLTVSVVFIVVVLLIPAGVHLGFRAPRIRERATPERFGLPFEAVRIPTRRGRSLFGWMLPCGRAKTTLVILHGWGSNAELMLPVAAPLHRAGYHILLFDARGHGRSDGDTFASLPRFAEDLGMAIEWLRHHRPEHAERIGVIGHSVGAGAAILEASRNPAIATVVSIAAFAHPAGLTESSLRRFRLPRVVTRLVIRYVEWVIGHPFDSIAPLHTIARVHCPVLLVHGRDDEVIPLTDAHRILAQAPPGRARLVEIEGAGHGSTEQIDHAMGDVLAFLEAQGLRGSPPNDPLSDGHASPM
jgi:pimeloyl-ACP methyl ester carboxylesterase